MEEEEEVFHYQDYLFSKQNNLSKSILCCHAVIAKWGTRRKFFDII